MTNTETLDAKRAAIESRLNALRIEPTPEVADLLRKADKAVADFRAQASALEGELAEIDSQIGLRERDRRAAAEQQRQQQWLDNRRAILEAEETRLAAIADAEAACRALVDAITRMLAANKHMAKLAQALLPSGKVPSSLSATELVSRTAARIASTMATIPGHRYRLASLEWPGGASALYPADRSWRADEEKRTAVDLIQPLLEKGQA